MGNQGFLSVISPVPALYPVLLAVRRWYFFSAAELAPGSDSPRLTCKQR